MCVTGVGRLLGVYLHGRQTVAGFLFGPHHDEHLKGIHRLTVRRSQRCALLLSLLYVHVECVMSLCSASVATEHTWKLEDSFLESVHSSTVGSGDCFQTVRLAHKCFSP